LKSRREYAVFLHSGGSADRSDTGKIADGLKEKQQKDILTGAVCAAKRERVTGFDSSMLYQKGGRLVEFSVPGAK